MTQTAKTDNCVKRVTPHRPWTPDEVATLSRLLAEGRDDASIGRVLGRSRWSVRAKGERLRFNLPGLGGGWLSPPIEPVVQRVANHFQVRLADVRGPTNYALWCWPRQVAMWVALHIGCTYSGTGRYFRRDHGTVMHAVRKVERCRATSETDRWLTDKLLEEARQDAPLAPPAAVLVPEAHPPAQVKKTASDDPGAVGGMFYDRQINNGREFLEEQNERFAAAMRAELGAAP